MKDHRPVCTWIPNSDFELLQRLAALNNVTAASFVRGIIIDALQDQLSIDQLNTASQNQQLLPI